MIRFAYKKDIPRIMKFIDEYWKKNHIMSRDQDLFEFQHKWEEEISFVISEKDNEITGVLGYIPYGNKNRDVTLALWKANKTEDTMQGINMLTYLREKGDVRTISCAGINPKIVPIYRFLGFTTGKMKQWYRLRNTNKYTIAKISNKTIPKVILTEKADIFEIKDFDFLNFSFGIDECIIREGQLVKSKEYIKRRYFEHPTFEYVKYGIVYDDKKLFVVLRVQKYNNSAALRVIDCIGDKYIFKLFTQDIDRLLNEFNCEYADCYETGVNDDIFVDGGWLDVYNSGNIIPEYFSPFEQRNIDIYYMSEKDGTVLFKGDGDMDRPN